MMTLKHENIWPADTNATAKELRKMYLAGAAKNITLMTGCTAETKNNLYIGFYRVNADGTLADTWDHVGTSTGKKKAYKTISAVRSDLEIAGLTEGWNHVLEFYFAPSDYCATPKHGE